MGITLIGPALTAWVAALVVRRKLQRDFPFFFAYLILSIIVPLLRLSVSGNYVTFFIVFWATEALYALAALFALHEVFHEVFLAFYMLWWWFRLLFPGAAVFIAFLSIRNALHNPALQNPRPMEIVFALATGVNYLEAALFGLFFTLVLLLGIRWKSYPFGIVAGFGLYALGGMLAYGLRSEFGTKYTNIVKYALPVAYVVGLLAWLLTFLGRPDPEVVHAWRGQVTPEQFLAQARAFVRITKGYFGGKR